MFSFFTNNLLWSHGGLLLGAVAALGVMGFLWRPFFYGAAASFIFLLFFFRNPDRICPEALHDANVIVCPADGKIVAIETLKNDPQFGTKIAIFLSPLDVHVNRVPLSGKITQVSYHKGSFAMAFLPKSSELNERNDILLETDSGTLVRVRQIAGTLARTIVCWVREGERVQAGQLYGMIKLGSRVELFLPPGTELAIKDGQRVIGDKRY